MDSTGTASSDKTIDRQDRITHRPLIVLVSALAGFVLTVVWSAEFVDRSIGGTVSTQLLGHDPGTTPIAGVAAGVLFAFVSGLAGSFTACNVAALGAVAPMLGAGGRRRDRFLLTLAPLGWLALGTLLVSCTYGALVGLVGTSMPQFSVERPTPGSLTPWLTQSVIVFGLIGLIMTYLGLAALNLVPDPFSRSSQRSSAGRMVFMGMLIGGFLIGRPFPLFRQMFRDAAESGNPLYGAAAFGLQSIGNIVVVSLIFITIMLLLGDRLARSLRADPGRLATVNAVALIAFGVFTFLYWDVRLFAVLDIIPWYPLAPWV